MLVVVVVVVAVAPAPVTPPRRICLSRLVRSPESDCAEAAAGEPARAFSIVNFVMRTGVA
jgi:hypothetical protein